MPRKPHVPVICDCGNHAFSPLTLAAIHIFDTKDAELAGRWRWSCSDKTHWSAVRNNWDQGRKEYFHRVVTSAPEGMVVDHINGNQADNRRSNLRICTNQENSWNRRKRADSSQKFKGVYRVGHLWRYTICISGSVISESFSTEEEAAAAYNEVALDAFGEFARLNAIYPSGRAATRSAIGHPKFKKSEGEAA